MTTLAAVFVICLPVLIAQVPIALYFRRRAFKAGHEIGFACGYVKGNAEAHGYWTNLDVSAVQAYTEMTEEKVRKERRRA
jgi:hypothetical protein